MATLQHSSMGSRPTTAPLKTELDMDTFFDFNQGTNQSPVTATSSKTDALSPFEKEERQQFNGPSHDYGQWKQQVGLPVGSLANMPNMNSNGVFDGFNSGVSEMDFNNSNFSWNSGLDFDGDMGMDLTSQPAMPAMFFPAPNEGSSSNFVNPNNLTGQDEPKSNVGRLWPGMHQQQAQQMAMQKAAQAQAVQQRQMKMQAQQAQYRQANNGSQSQNSQASTQQSQGSAKRASHVTEPHVEESISRLLSQMRQNSSAASDDAESNAGDNLPHIARMRKDDEDMDEDERLLASEEGKKLSSKERRQLRNKVSARAFRSRRKEYISQLEGDLALKAQETNALRSENQALMQENERYRGLIETLLRHPAYTPFINDLSKDASVLSSLQPPSQPSQPKSQPTATPTQQPAQPQQQQQVPQQDNAPDYMNFDASQLQIPQQQQQQSDQPQQQVGMAMVPETDFSKLNINGFNRSMNFSNFSVNAYATTALPAGPDPVDLLAHSPAYLPASASNDSDLTVLLAKLDGAARRVDFYS